MKKNFAIKNMFYLPFDTRLQFLKTFILPHFDYCSSLFIYMSKALIEKISRVYNFAIFIILKIKLSFLDNEKQLEVLRPLKLLPYKYRLLYRFSMFSYKLLNQVLLRDLYDELNFKVNIKCLRSSSLSILVVLYLLVELTLVKKESLLLNLSIMLSNPLIIFLFLISKILLILILIFFLNDLLYFYKSYCLFF